MWKHSNKRGFNVQVWGFWWGWLSELWSILPESEERKKGQRWGLGSNKMASSLRFLSYIQEETFPWQIEIELLKTMTWIKDANLNIIVRWVSSWRHRRERSFQEMENWGRILESANIGVETEREVLRGRLRNCRWTDSMGHRGHKGRASEACGQCFPLQRGQRRRDSERYSYLSKNSDYCGVGKSSNVVDFTVGGVWRRRDWV